MKTPAKAVKRCRDFLDERAFDLGFEAEIINYEYAKQMDGRNIDKKRVAAAVTQNEMVKGVCYLLLGQDDDALKLFRQEAEKRFSKIDDCLHWPVIWRHERELSAIREELLKSKRRLTDLPKN